MLRSIFLFAMTLTLAVPAQAATKPHVISFGKWTTVKWLAGNDESQPLDLKIRPLIVDGRIKEYTFGDPHEITERLFAIRRAFRVNDALPNDKSSGPRWQWQRGGWLLVERPSGRVSVINLPDFDPYYSSTSWYRDYAAYCGISSNGAKLFLIVSQLGRRKPVLRKVMDEVATSDTPDSICPGTTWQRQPTRVTFMINRDQGRTYEIHGHAADLIQEEEETPDSD